MLYVKLDRDGNPARYPYTEADIRRDFPDVSLPVPMEPGDVEHLGVFAVLETPPPVVSHEFNLFRHAVRGQNGWIEEWEIITAAPEEIKARDDIKAAQVRSERDQLLSESDWTQMPDAINAGADQDAWAIYRQALRDLTGQPGFPWDVTWPEAPVLTPPPILVDYRAFYDALIASPAYGIIRGRAVASAPVLAACVEFIAAIGDAKSGRPNPPAIQACVDLLCAAAQFSPEELAALGSVMAVGGLDQVYSLPAT